MPFYIRPLSIPKDMIPEPKPEEPFGELPVDDREMELDEMYNWLVKEFINTNDRADSKDASRTLIVTIAMLQNQTAAQIARCIVTAEKCGESLGTEYEPHETLNYILGQLSLHTRRMQRVVDKFDYICTDYILHFNKLQSLYTTIRRLKSTRLAYEKGELKGKPKADVETPQKEVKEIGPASSAFRADAVYRTTSGSRSDRAEVCASSNQKNSGELSSGKSKGSVGKASQRTADGIDFDAVAKSFIKEGPKTEGKAESAEADSKAQKEHNEWEAGVNKQLERLGVLGLFDPDTLPLSLKNSQKKGPIPKVPVRV